MNAANLINNADLLLIANQLQKSLKNMVFKSSHKLFSKLFSKLLNNLLNLFLKIVFSSILILFGLHNTFAQESTKSAPEIDLNWIKAPNKVNITKRATIELTGDLAYLNDKDTNSFLKMTGNLPRENSYTLANLESNWFAIFDFSDEGYVKDDEKIDADALLKSLKENNKAGLEERKKRGLDPRQTHLNFIINCIIEKIYKNKNKKLRI